MMIMSSVFSKNKVQSGLTAVTQGRNMEKSCGELDTT